MKNIIRKLRLMFYNKINNTRIHSIYASLDATYGINVGVGYNTIVTDNVRLGDYSYVNSN